jgi:hypothetical protein
MAAGIALLPPAGRTCAGGVSLTGPDFIFSRAGIGGMLAAAMSGDGKDAMEPGFAAAEIDTSKPHPARMYNAYLGGNDNYPADRAAVRQIMRVFPEVRAMALADRAFMQRAVRFLAAEAGGNRALSPFYYTIIMTVLHFRLAVEIGKCIR